MPGQEKENVTSKTSNFWLGSFISRQLNKQSSGRWLGLLILFSVFFVLFLKNFPFDTWYTGWDNLHPEFNFWLNTKRAISAVWQENQGLGTFGGHGYAATLPHTLFLWLLSLLLPVKYLRSTFTFLTLITGTLGVYFLIDKMVEKRKVSLQNIAALSGALFYLLNFGTIQNFYIPLEAFTVHFATLPWLFYALINFLERRSKKNLIIFSLITFLSAPQGFIPPLFMVYFLLLSGFLFFYILEKVSFKRIKTTALILIVSLILNAYWLLPVGYYTFTRSDVYLNAYNNLSSTGDFILKNKKYGNLKDLVLLRGFLTETPDIDKHGQNFLIFQPWLEHFEKKWIIYLGFLYFSVILIGALSLLIKKHRFLYSAFLLSFILIFALLATNVFPFNFISQLLQNIPVFKQAFRVAFTKFSISLSFCYAVLLGLGVRLLIDTLKNITKTRTAAYAFGLLISFSLIYFSLPAFRGNFFYKRTKINIPQPYFELFEFFKSQNKNTRIANLPQGWSWGWSIYRWDYSGSGFLWYGIEQPILDRAFDVWGTENEVYYWELVHSLYSENFSLFEEILEKYHISWLILDKNIIPYPSPKSVLFADNLEDYLDRSEKVVLKKTFSSPDSHVYEIKVYQVSLVNKPDDFLIFANLDELKNAGPQYNWVNLDQAYLDEGAYYVTQEEEWDIYYPFRSLFTGRRQEELEFEIKDEGELISFKQTLPVNLQNYVLHIPSINKKDFLERDAQDLGKTQVKLPEIYFDDRLIFAPKDEEDLTGQEIEISHLTTGNLEVRIPKIGGYLAYDSKADYDFLHHEAKDCDLSEEGSFKQEVVRGNLQFASFSSANCFDVILPNLWQKSAYLVKIESESEKGKSLQVTIINHESKKPDLETSLAKDKEHSISYLINPPMKPFGRGYSLHFNNLSIGEEEAVNYLKRVTVNPVPFNFLKELKFVKPRTKEETGRQLLVYSQSFDPGWKLWGTKGAKHVLINNWANGWEIDNSKLKMQNEKFYIIFWPQLLEYFGFGLLLIPLVMLIRGRGKRERNTPRG